MIKGAGARVKDVVDRFWSDEGLGTIADDFDMSEDAVEAIVRAHTGSSRARRFRRVQASRRGQRARVLPQLRLVLGPVHEERAAAAEVTPVALAFCPGDGPAILS